MNTAQTKAEADLKAFLRDHGLTFEAAAEALRTHKSAVYQWSSGKGRPRIEFREAIERWTNGTVKADDWLTDEERAATASVVPFAPEGPTPSADEPATGTEG